MVVAGRRKTIALFIALGIGLISVSLLLYIGWVLLNWSPRERRLVNCWAADHTTTLAGGLPILALDMYEHADHLDYGGRRRPMSTPSWLQSTGRMQRAVYLPTCRAKGAYDGL